MHHVSNKIDEDLLALYEKFGWPIYKKYKHAYECFQMAVTNPEVLDEFDINAETKHALLTFIKHRMAPQALKFRADVDVSCFEEEGVDAIKAALREGLAASDADENDPCHVRIQLIASPTYVLEAQCFDLKTGIAVLTDAIERIRTEIEKRGGMLEVQEGPRSLSETEEKLLEKSKAEEAARLLEEGESDEDEDEEGITFNPDA